MLLNSGELVVIELIGHTLRNQFGLKNLLFAVGR